MRLKPIEPRMAILCENKEQGAAVVEQLLKQGATWNGFYSANYSDENNKCYLNSNMTFCFYGGYIANTKFSDLVIPELSPEEVWCGLGDIDDKVLSSYFEELDGDRTREEIICEASWSELVDLVTIWKANHEKKEPETEWVDVIRVYNGGDVVYEIWCDDVPADKVKAEAEKILKMYLENHSGNYIAVIEHACRVKK